MTLYLDTANTQEWDDLMPTGLFHGITTNPLLAQRAGLAYADIDWSDLAKRAADHGAAELHAQIVGPTEAYVDWAGALYEAGASAGIETVVKIPLVESAIRATPAIKSLGGRILMTACYDARQMFVATALKADFIAPYFARMGEAGVEALEHMVQMQAIHDEAAHKVKILVASLRSAEQMCMLAELGLKDFTIGPDVARELLGHDLSQAAFDQFEDAAR